MIEGPCGFMERSSSLYIPTLPSIYPPSSHRYCGRGNITILVFHVIPQSHVTKGSSTIMDRSPLKLVTILPSIWALEIRRELVDLEGSRRNNLRILGIKEDPRESWEECESKIYDLLEEKLEIYTSNITIERAHRVGEKSNDKERATVV